MKLLINRRHSIYIQFLKDCQVSIDIGSPYRFVLKTRIVPAVVHDVYSLVCISIGNSMICSDIWHKYHE